MKKITKTEYHPVKVTFRIRGEKVARAVYSVWHVELRRSTLSLYMLNIDQTLGDMFTIRNVTSITSVTSCKLPFGITEQKTMALLR